MRRVRGARMVVMLLAFDAFCRAVRPRTTFELSRLNAATLTTTLRVASLAKGDGLVEGRIHLNKRRVALRRVLVHKDI